MGIESEVVWAMGKNGKKPIPLLDDTDLFDDELPEKKVTHRKLYQCLVLLIVTSSILGQGLAAASAGYILPQIWDPESGDAIQVTREAGAWYGKP